MESNLSTDDVDNSIMNTDLAQEDSTASIGSSVRTGNAESSSKTLKRCLSVPIIRQSLHTPNSTYSNVMTTRSAAAAALASAKEVNMENLYETPKKYQQNVPDSSTSSFSTNHLHIGIPRSNPSSREVSPAPVFNIFAPRARRYSASSSPLGAAPVSGAPLCITPRVSQLRQEECVDINSREVNHERESNVAMQMSQSWEDLTLVAENWSCKSEEYSNPLQVSLPSTITTCSSPSPTSNRPTMRLPYGLSPSPTRRTFATRRSMSPIAMRPSQLGSVKRKFELEDNWNMYSSPPIKKIFIESRGSSPVYQPPSVCPSPDSGTSDERVTPKLFISKLCTTNTNNSSTCSSPISASPSSVALNSLDSTSSAGICSSSSGSSASSISGGSEPMSIGNNIDEGISMADGDDKILTPSPLSTSQVTPMSTDISVVVTAEDAALMDDNKSETSSIGGCSSISIESTSWDSVTKPITSTFANKLLMDDSSISSSTLLSPKNFFINKHGNSGAKKFIVNHDNSPNNSFSDPTADSVKVSSTTSNREKAATDISGNVVSNSSNIVEAMATSVIVQNNNSN